MNDAQRTELSELCQAAAEGNLADDEEHRLNELVRSDERACALYVDYLEVHALLAWRHGLVEPLELPLAVARPSQSTSRSLKPLWAAAAALVLALGGVALLFLLTGGVPWQSNSQKPIAMVVSEEDVEWSGRLRHNGDQQLSPGRQRIDSGTARIELTNGVLLAAAGPCDFEITSPDRLHLYAGKVNVYSPLATQGFTVTTPRGVQIVDLGTRFGVWVNEAESVHVHLFEGALLVNNRTEMKPGEAIIVDAAGTLSWDTADGDLFPQLHRE